METKHERSLGLERKEDGVWLTASNEFGQNALFNLGHCKRADGSTTLQLQVLIDIMVNGVDKRILNGV